MDGHDVTIYERGYRIGGCLTMSSIFSPSYENLLKYYKRQLQKHPQIKVKLHTEVTPELVKKVSVIQTVIDELWEQAKRLLRDHPL